MNKSKKHEQNLRRAEKAERRAALFDLVRSENSHWESIKDSFADNRTAYNEAAMNHQVRVKEFLNLLVELEFPGLVDKINSEYVEKG